MQLVRQRGGGLAFQPPFTRSVYLLGVYRRRYYSISGNLGNTENSPLLGGAGNHINLLFIIRYCILVALGENLRSSLVTGEIRGLSCFLNDLMLELPSF